MKKISLIIGFMVASMMSLVSSVNVNAASNGDIMKKWVFAQYYRCAMNSINSPVQQKRSGSVIDSVFSASGEANVLLPSEQFQHSVGSEAVNCNKILAGTSGLTGVAGYANLGSPDWSQLDAAQSLMTTLGYDEDAEDDSYKFRIMATKTTTVEEWNNGVTTESTPERRDVGTDLITVKRDANGLMRPSVGLLSNILSNDFDVYSYREGDAYYVAITATGLGWTIDNASTNNGAIVIKVGNTLSEFLENVQNSGLSNAVWIKTKTTNNSNNYGERRKTTTVNYSFRVNGEGEGLVDGASDANYIYPNGSSAKYDRTAEVIRKLSGLSLGQLKLSDDERYTLYLYYLNSSLPLGSANRLTCEMPADTNGLLTISLKESADKWKICYLNPGGVDLNKKYYTLESSTGARPAPYIGTITLNGIINWFNSLSPEAIGEVPLVSETTITDESQGLNDTDGISDLCYKSGLEGGSWIVCPAIKNMTGMVEVIDGLLKNMLSIDSQWYGNDTATERAWSAFRDIANAIVVVVLLVVIFSQLTGYGIDNYGIKKILPRLIVMAVVINLSFILCQLAIDLSNILGSGLSTTLQNAAVGLYGDKASSTTVASIVGALFSMATGASMVSGTVISIAAVASSGILVAITVVLALLVAVVAIGAFFLSVSARMIIVIAFTALAPVALACYILPNTQGIAKKWFNIFKAALLVYPICGFLFGLSFIIQGLIVGDGKNLPVWLGIIAIFAKYLPFFALPALLKGTLNAVGTVGNALTTMTGGARRGVAGAQQALRSSAAYQEAAKITTRNRQLERANRNIARLTRKQGRLQAGGGDLNKNDTRALADAYAVKSKIEKDFESADVAVATNRYEGVDPNAIKNDWRKAWDSGDTRQLIALTSVLAGRNAKDTAKFVGAEVVARGRNVEENGKFRDDRTRRNFSALQSIVGSNGNLAQYLASKDPDSALMIESAGVGSDGKIHNIDYFSRTQEIVDTAGKWASTSTNAAIRGMQAGTLNGDMTNKILTSTNEGIVDELTKESKKDLFRAHQILGGDATSGNIISQIAYGEGLGSSHFKDVATAYNGMGGNAEAASRLRSMSGQEIAEWVRNNPPQVNGGSSAGGGAGSSQGGPTPTPTPRQGGPTPGPAPTPNPQPTPGPRPVPPRPGDFGGGGVDLRGQRVPSRESGFEDVYNRRYAGGGRAQQGTPGASDSEWNAANSDQNMGE